MIGPQLVYYVIVVIVVLLLLYCYVIAAVKDDVEPLLAITKELQSHGEMPRQSFHTALSSLLKEHGREVPFVLAGNSTTDSMANITL